MPEKKAEVVDEAERLRAKAESDAEFAARPEEEPGKARFIRGDVVVDAENKVIEGLSVKDGAIVGTEKKAEEK